MIKTGELVYGKADDSTESTRSEWSWRTGNSGLSLGYPGSELLSSRQRFVAASIPCLSVPRSTKLSTVQECLDMFGSFAARGWVISPMIGMRVPGMEGPSKTSRAGTIPALVTVPQAIELYRGYRQTHSKDCEASPMAARNMPFDYGASTLRTLRSPSPPVLLVGRHPASRFLSALLNRLVQGVRVDGGMLPAAVQNATTVFMLPNSNH